MVAASSAPTPGAPLASMVKIYSKPGKLPPCFSTKRLIALSHIGINILLKILLINGQVMDYLNCKIFCLKTILESSHPKQLSDWYRWEDQIEKDTKTYNGQL